MPAGAVLAAEGEAEKAEEAPAATAVEDAPADNDTEYTFIPYLWFSGINGRMGAGGMVVSVDEDFSDLIEVMKFGVMGALEVKKGDTIGFVDLLYMQLGDDTKAMGTKVEVTVDLLIARFGCGRRVLDVPIGDGEGQVLSVDAFGGGRYYYLKNRLDVRGGPRLSSSIDWIDLITGLKIQAGINEKWRFVTVGDIGGFDIGSSSRLSWDLMSGFGVDLTERTDLFFGYRVLDIDRNKSGAVFDAKMAGPIVGATFTF